jgi:hypothetical protein
MFNESNKRDGLNEVKPIIGPGRLHDGFRWRSTHPTRCALPNRKCQCFPYLSGKMRIMAVMPYLTRRESNKQREMILR